GFLASAPYITNAFIVGLLGLALVNGLFAMSVDLMAGYAGLVTLGHAGILASSMYGAGYVADKADGPFWLQILVGLAAGLGMSAVFGIMAMRSSGVYFIMITIAQGMIIWGLSIRLNGITGAENGLLGIRRPEAIDPQWIYYYIVLAVVLVCAGLLFVVVRSPFGLSLKGLRESEVRIRMLGHNSALLKFYMFMISGFFATVAGLLLVYLNEFVNPTDAILASSAIPVLMTILGGLGTMIGAMIGSFIITFIQNYISLYVERWPILMGTLFVLVMLFARDGIVGTITRWWYARIDVDRSSSATPPVTAAVEADL
ncbi:MAG: branched-chain amino acid ABC transporter permease, partial [Acidimicrobiales bacterium]